MGAGGADQPRGTGRWVMLRAVLPYLVTAGLFALGLYALQRLLAPVDLADVAAQIRATPWSVIALALLATLCGYLALAGYDWSALRYIGKPLPLPVVLTGGLMAYAFGNTMGLSALSGGAVRWRIYSGLGLTGFDVAAVSTFAAVSFGVAATLVGLAALAAHPVALAAFLPFGPGIVRLAALAAIVAIVLPLVLASVSGRALRLGRYSLRAPSLPILLGQVLFSLGDICFSALTLYLLLPVTDYGFLTFLAVFAAATMAGVISHVPGGVGVFETVVIAALPSTVPVDQAAAALLLFRLTYFLLPFALALVVLALYELWRGLGRPVHASAAGRVMQSMEPALRAVALVAPLSLAAMIFGSGLWMSVSVLIPPASDAAEAADDLLPLAFLESSALLSSALGAALIVLALGVVRRSLGAWILSLGVLGAGALVALIDGADARRAAILAVAMLVLLPFRRSFHRHATLTHAALSPGWIVLVLSSVIAFGFVFFLANKSTLYADELWWQFAMDENAPRALRAGLVGSLLVGLGALALLLRRPRFVPGPVDPATVARALKVLAGDPGASAPYALARPRPVMLSGNGAAFIAFDLRPGAWVAAGGPVGPAPDAEEVAGQFADAARRSGQRPVFAAVPDRFRPMMLDLGFLMVPAGEAAWLDLGAVRDGTAPDPLARMLREVPSRALAEGLSLTLRAPTPAETVSIPALWRVARIDRAGIDKGGTMVARAHVLGAEGGQAMAVGQIEGPEAAGLARDVLAVGLILRLAGAGVARLTLGRLPPPGDPGADAETRAALAAVAGIGADPPLAPGAMAWLLQLSTGRTTLWHALPADLPGLRTGPALRG